MAISSKRRMSLSSATVFTITGPSVELTVAALVAGDGVDLVVKRSGGRSRTEQLSVQEARQLATALTDAADESGLL